MTSYTYKFYKELFLSWIWLGKRTLLVTNLLELQWFCLLCQGILHSIANNGIVMRNIEREREGGENQQGKRSINTIHIYLDSVPVFCRRSSIWWIKMCRTLAHSLIMYIDSFSHISQTFQQLYTIWKLLLENAILDSPPPPLPSLDI